MNYGMDLVQFADYVVMPATMRIALNTLAADRLVLGTALVESELVWIDQVDPLDKPGPAFGFFQMERVTHDSIWNDYLKYNRDLANLVRATASWSAGMHIPDATELRTNMLYAAAMCRVRYRWAKPKLPDPDDALGMAKYWKAHYNTHLGKGTVEKAVSHFKRAISAIG